LTEINSASPAGTYLDLEWRKQMPIKDVLLPLVGQPSAAAIAAIDKCVAVAGDIGARVTAFAVEEDILVRPQVIVPLDLENGSPAEALQSVSNARGLLQAFDAAADRFGVRNGHELSRYAAADIPAKLARSARLKDLAIVPVRSDDSRSEKIIEELVFESGRPILICPEELASELSIVFDNVAIAWDHTAPAARAVADAMPMLQSATNVHIITATDEETTAQAESGAALAGHLAAHGVKAVFETVGIGGSSIGKVFEAYVRTHAIDLLVMGAYRHSRLSEIVWGGATKTVIGRPPCWVMMSR
jgi:nucleotide-binding universal stress UspA family protein